jgi:hypothetical protein
MQYTEVIVGGWEGESNIGFVTELILIDIKDIVSLTDPEQDPAIPMTVGNSNLILKQNSKIFRVVFRSRSCTFSESQLTTANGKVSSVSISFDLAKNSQQISQWLHQNIQRKWVALYRDGNGLDRISGDNENGLGLSLSRSINNSNGMSLQLSQLCNHQSWFFENLKVFQVGKNIQDIGAIDSGSNSGIITDMLLFDIEDVESIADSEIEAIELMPHTIKNGNIKFGENAKISRMKFRSRSCTFVESENQANDGKIFSILIGFDLPKIDKNLSEWLRRNINRRWLALFQDGNGCKYIAGDLESGLTFQHNKNLGSVNNVRVQLLGRSWHLTWHIESIHLDELYAQFSDEFSEDFLI